MVAVRSKFLKPNENCILKPLCFFRQFVLVKFENCFLKLAFPLWVFQFSVFHRSSSDHTSVGKRAKHALGSGFGRGVTGAGTWTIRGGQLAPVKARGRPRHTMLWSNYRTYTNGKLSRTRHLSICSVPNTNLRTTF